MLVDVVIYTYNRACQLDLLLRSIKDNFLNVNKVWVLEDWSSDEFKSGLEKLKGLDYGLDVTYLRQTRATFYNVLKGVVDNSTTEYILPLCDDDVFIRETDIADIANYVDDNVIGVHLRYSADLTISYGKWGVLPLPTFLPAGPYLKWDWTTYNTHSRWGYAYQAGGLIYKTAFFKHMIDNTKFSQPNDLEGALMGGRNRWGKNFTVAFKHSPIVNVSVNRVQNDVPNRGGRDVNYSPEELNSVFLEGSIISTEGLYNMINNCEFIEIPLDFVRDER